MKMRNIAVTSLIALVGLLPVTSASAQEVSSDIFKVEKAENQTIDRHRVCREVLNRSGTDIMVPVNTAAEWSVGTHAFLNNLTTMPGVSVRTCETVVDVTASSCNARKGTIQSAFTADQWGRDDYIKTFTVEKDCKMCGEDVQLTIGQPWGGELRIVVAGIISGEANADRVGGGFNANTRGKDGQRARVKIMPSGNISRSGPPGAWGRAGQSATAQQINCNAALQSCWGYPVTSNGGMAGAPGRGGGCGQPPSMGGPGSPAVGIPYTVDSMSCSPDPFTPGKTNCYVFTSYNTVRGTSGTSGTPGSPEIPGVINPGNVVMVDNF